MEKLPKMEEVKALAAGESAQAEEVLKLIDRTEVRTEPEIRWAVTAIAEVKGKGGALDAKRKSWVDPLNAVVADINATFKPVIGFYSRAEDLLKGKVAVAHEAMARERSDLLARVEAAPQEQREALVAEATAKVPPKVPGMSVRESWTGVITDASAVLAWCLENDQTQFLVPNEKALKAHAKALGRDPMIPGFDAAPKATVSVTTSKVER